VIEGDLGGEMTHQGGEQRLVAHAYRERVGGGHHPTEISQVVHTFTVADGIIHQQEIVSGSKKS